MSPDYNSTVKQKKNIHLTTHSQSEVSSTTCSKAVFTKTINTREHKTVQIESHLLHTAADN